MNTVIIDIQHMMSSSCNAISHRWHRQQWQARNPKLTQYKITQQPQWQQLINESPWRTVPCNTESHTRGQGKKTAAEHRELKKCTEHRNKCWSHVTTPSAHTAGHPITFGKECMSQFIAGTIGVLKVTNQCTDRLQDTSNTTIITHDSSYLPWTLHLCKKNIYFWNKLLLSVYHEATFHNYLTINSLNVSQIQKNKEVSSRRW